MEIRCVAAVSYTLTPLSKQTFHRQHLLHCEILSVIAQCYVFFRHSAENTADLSKHQITHILNAAHSKCEGQPGIYRGKEITYMGIEAHDSCGFDMSVNFLAAAVFIHRALSRGGKVLVHCHVGLSRSATLVLAYLMLRQNLTLVGAICAVKDKHGVRPNRGFLRQLIKLDGQLFDTHP
ncbi:dual specificity protein phosphatase 26-like [Limanda limanda]|uniref:dual specificity protein phosphatase 26-like n=1 Tax=Limanda limanda TaxID=27771 RepID=UPI0029C61A57|nr:dual specificity protein phosphatase 26-like [Limanda limanda]